MADPDLVWFKLEVSTRRSSRASFCLYEWVGEKEVGIESQKAFEVAEARTSGLFNRAFSRQTVFRGRASVYWQTEGHNWAPCPKGTDIRPGLETIFQQQAAYTQQKSHLNDTESYSSTQKLSKATKKKKKRKGAPVSGRSSSKVVKW